MGIHERKEREREQRRNDILASARTVFLKYGIEHASMDRIAQEAELAKGTLYLYFRNRDELIAAMMVEDLAVLIERLRQVQQMELPADEKLLQAVFAFHMFSKSNEFFYRIVSQLNIKSVFDCSDETDTVRYLVQYNNDLMTLIANIIQEGVDSGMFYLEHTLEHTVRILLYALKGTMVLYENGMMPPALRGETTETLLRDSATLFIRGLRMQPPLSAS